MVEEKKIGVIIQARYDSNRLPGKVLLPLPFSSNKTILDRIIDRLATFKNLHTIIATSNEKADDIIVDFAKSRKYNFFRGSKENVLQRFVEASKHYELDIVIRITGDNPIVLIDLIRRGLEVHTIKNVDYSRNIGLPYGTSFEIINSKVLEKVLRLTNDTEDLEHVTLFIKKNPSLFSIFENDFSNLDIFPDECRFTIDYPSDYAMMNILFQYLEKENFDYDLNKLFLFFKNNEWIFEINKNNNQKKKFVNRDDEIAYALTLLNKLELFHAASKLK